MKAAQDRLSGIDPIIKVWIFLPIVGVTEKGINTMTM